MINGTRAVVLALALAAVSCSEGSPREDAGRTQDASDAGACGAMPPRARVWLSTSDYASGTLCALGTESRCARANVANATADTLLARHGDAIVALEYTEGTRDQIAAYRPADDGSLVALGAGSPRATAQTANVRGYLPIDESTALFSRNDQSSLGVWSLATHSIVGEISLDSMRLGAPRAAPSRIVGFEGRAFVLLQRWDAARFERPVNGAIAVVDLATRTLVDADPRTPAVDAIELPFSNPFGDPSARDGVLYVPCAGALRDAADGAIVRVDLRGLRVIDAVATEAALGANPLHALSLDADRLLVVTMTEPAVNDRMTVASSKLVEWSIAAGRVTRTWMEVPGYSLTAPVLASDGRVYIGDRGYERPARPSGVVAFDARTSTRLWSEPTPVGLPPYALLAE